MQQPHAELRLQPPHRLAEPGGAAPAAAPHRESRRPGDRDEGVQIAEIGSHCPRFRTACADHAGYRASANAIAWPRQQEDSHDRPSHPGTFALGSRIVKRLGYGAMQLAGPGVFGPPRDRDAALAVLRDAVASGVDHIDTSDFYGPHVTNEVIREALRPIRRIS